MSRRLPPGHLVKRALRLRCPICGEGRPFPRGWLRMAPTCEACGWAYEREPGYFLGSIYFNYGFTAVLTMAVVVGLIFGCGVGEGIALPAAAALAVVFGLWFFRYSRCLWMALDLAFDPPDEP